MFQELLTECTKSVDLKPLQCLAAMRLAISVCKSEDVLHLIRRFSKNDGNGGTVGFSDHRWERLCRAVKRNLSQICVPGLIIDRVLENLWPISFEIFKWIFYHFEDTGIDYSSHFCWTPQLNIDYVKTAEILVKNDALDIIKRFKLACLYCFDSEVRSLWDQMTISEKRNFFVRWNLVNSTQHPIVHFWTYYIQDVPLDLWGNKAFNTTKLFIFSVKNGYLNATKFFLDLLKPGLRNRMIYNCFEIHLSRVRKINLRDQSAIACFLLCQLPSRFNEMISTCRQSLIFLYFLEWPRQRYFMIVVNRLRRHIYYWTYIELLPRIFHKVIGDFKDHDYKELFVQFWLQSPNEMKTYVGENRDGCVMFLQFVKKHFGFIFEENSFTIKAKFRVIALQAEIPENETHFDRQNVEFFKFFIRERITTKASIERFKNERITYYCPYKQEFSNLPMEELMYLMDGILGIV